MRKGFISKTSSQSGPAIVAYTLRNWRQKQIKQIKLEITQRVKTSAKAGKNFVYPEEN